VSTSRLTVRNFTRVPPRCQGLFWIFGRCVLSPQFAVSGDSLRSGRSVLFSYSPLTWIVASFADFLPLQDSRPSREVLGDHRASLLPPSSWWEAAWLDVLSYSRPAFCVASRSAFRFLREPRLSGGVEPSSSTEPLFRLPSSGRSLG